ncbi:unnamed protein product [Closterium sp. Yama58-4]|nr:unnamed protein product [Closterium sp. Yama58-4]
MAAVRAACSAAQAATISPGNAIERHVSRPLGTATLSARTSVHKSSLAARPSPLCNTGTFLQLPRQPRRQPRCIRVVRASSAGSSDNATNDASSEGSSFFEWLKLPALDGLFGKKGETEVKASSEVESEEASEENVPEQEPELVKEEPPEELDVVIIGAGLAGLRAALALQEAGVACVVLEASDGVGGRVRTDEVDGFLLDRGFQIFLSAYPEAQQVMDYEALDLRPFYSGALVWFGGSFHRVADPFRHTSDGLSSLFNPIGSVFDKLRVGLLRLKAVSTPVDGILSSPETSIEEALKKQGFSNEMIDRFFRPFLGGIFFDNELSTSSRLMEFVLRMLALAPNTLPSAGIGALASHLASRLPSDSIRLNSPVSSISPAVPTDEADSKGSEAGSGVPSLLTMQDGKRILAKGGVIVAVEQPVAQRLLLGEGGSNSSSGGSSSSVDAASNSSATACQEPRSTVCLYFASDSPAPVAEPILFLNGSGSGIVNNLCFPSVVSPSYAPPDKTLVSVSLVGAYQDRTEAELEARVLSLPEHTGVLLPGGYVIVDPRSAEVAQIAEFVVTDMNAKMDAAVHLEIVNAAEKHASSGHTSSGYNSKSFSYDVVFTATTTTHDTHPHSPSRKASVAERWSKLVTSQYEAVVLKSLQGSLAVSSVVRLSSQAPVYIPFEEEVISYSTAARGDSMRDNDTVTGCSDGDVMETTL